MNSTIKFILPNKNKEYNSYNLSIPNNVSISNVSISTVTYLPINNVLLLVLRIICVPNKCNSAFLSVYLPKTNIIDQFENFSNYNAYSYPIIILNDNNIDLKQIDFYNDIDYCNKEINKCNIKNIYDFKNHNNHRFIIYLTNYNKNNTLLIYEYFIENSIINKINEYTDEHNNEYIVQPFETIIKIYNNYNSKDINIEDFKDFIKSLALMILDIKTQFTI